MFEFNHVPLILHPSLVSRCTLYVFYHLIAFMIRNLTGLWAVLKPVTVVEYSCETAVIHGEQEPEVRENETNINYH